VAPALARPTLVVATVALLCAGCVGSSSSSTTLPHEAFVAKLDPLCASFKAVTQSETAALNQKLAAHNLKGAGDLMASRLVPSLRRFRQQLAAIRPPGQDFTVSTAYKRDVGRFAAIAQQLAAAMRSGNGADAPHLAALNASAAAKIKQDANDLGTNQC
jgi:hypothetical protein